ncbi:hypothetical protein Pelo_1582 [Pelomyxa schiedti]|nr:hypothetical protein Pelo_1582 [Pelomyxa schiedti]
MMAASGLSLPPGWNLIDELRGVWSRELVDLPVAIDLPRLAGRIVVGVYDASTKAIDGYDDDEDITPPPPPRSKHHRRKASQQVDVLKREELAAQQQQQQQQQQQREEGYQVATDKGSDGQTNGLGGEGHSKVREDENEAAAGAGAVGGGEGEAGEGEGGETAATPRSRGKGKRRSRRKKAALAQSSLLQEDAGNVKKEPEGETVAKEPEEKEEREKEVEREKEGELDRVKEMEKEKEPTKASEMVTQREPEMTNVKEVIATSQEEKETAKESTPRDITDGSTDGTNDPVMEGEVKTTKKHRHRHRHARIKRDSNENTTEPFVEAQGDDTPRSETGGSEPQPLSDSVLSTSLDSSTGPADKSNVSTPFCADSGKLVVIDNDEFDYAEEPVPSSETTTTTTVAKEVTTVVPSVVGVSISTTEVLTTPTTTPKLSSSSTPTEVETLSSSATSTSTSNQDDSNDIRQTVVAVVSFLEGKTAVEKCEKFFANVEKGLQDKSGICAELFQEVLGATSKTARVFKAIHQNIIFIGVYALRAQLHNLPLTKDVRGKEGWRVHVGLNNQVITVNHTRREASCDANNKFWFEWVLTITFDGNMSDIQAATLRVNRLEFQTPITVQVMEKVRAALCGGSLLIS